MKSQTNRIKGSRRTFLTASCSAWLGRILPSSLVPTVLATREATASESKPSGSSARKIKAHDIRQQLAKFHLESPDPKNLTNGDPARWPDGRHSFSKCLPHNGLGEVEPHAYRALLRAITSQSNEACEQIPMAAPGKLVDLQAAFAYSLEGMDGHQTSLPPCPAFSSPQQASEMAELYWQALTRDVPFEDYSNSSLIKQAAEDMSRFSEFRGPKVNGSVTVETLFR